MEREACVRRAAGVGPSQPLGTLVLAASAVKAGNYTDASTLLSGLPSNGINRVLVPLLRADTAMTGLVVPAGTHTIILNYQPGSFTLGAIISIAALILGGLGFGIASITAQRKR